MIKKDGEKSGGQGDGHFCREKKGNGVSPTFIWQNFIPFTRWIAIENLL
jgi:hypothetical protein